MSEGLDAYEDTAAVEVPPGMVVEIEADPTLGYASIQNAVPVLRSLRLTNRTDKTFEQLVVLITCAPGFAQGVKLQFDQLAPGETRRISPIDLKPDHSYLADLQEAVKASIRVAVIHGTDELAQAEHPITVLAYDQWAGTRALPELLAAFCMPNNPAVDLLVGKASKLLRSSHPDLSMDGYQSKSRDVVWKQVSAMTVRRSVRRTVSSMVAWPHAWILRCSSPRASSKPVCIAQSFSRRVMLGSGSGCIQHVFRTR
jgi:hypothetical protein